MGRRRAVRPKGTGFRVWMRMAGSLLWRPAVFWMLPTAVLIFVCLTGLKFCRDQMSVSDRFQLVPPVVTYADLVGKGGDKTPPPWWDAEFENQINRAGAGAVGRGTSIRDDRVLDKLARAYASCPWVQEVRSLRKEYPNRIRPELTLRTPAAAVAIATSPVSYRLVGADGVPLPKIYAGWPQPGLNLPVIAGLGDAPAGNHETWQRACVEAIEIARLLQSSELICSKMNIAVVDASNFGERRDRNKSEFLVMTDNNCVIEWGRAVHTNNVGELPAAEKIAALEQYIRSGKELSGATLILRFNGIRVTRRPSTDGNSS